MMFYGYYQMFPAAIGKCGGYQIIWKPNLCINISPAEQAAINLKFDPSFKEHYFRENPYCIRGSNNE